MAKMGVLEKLVVNSNLDYLFHKYFGISKLLKNISTPLNGSILEVGAGVGITTNFLANKFPNSSITAVDYDEKQVEIAKQKNLNPNVKFQQADGTNLPFTERSFDFCFAILVFHHISNFPKAISEIYRVLKPNGKFYIYDIPAKTWNPLHRWIKLGTPGIFSKGEFIKLLEQAGFKILNVESKLGFVIECYKI